MFSCLTTTGATIFDSSHLIAEPIHLWRALIGWLGGFVFLLIAFAILEPMNVGGFELFRTNSIANVATRIIIANNSEDRLLKYCRKLFPIYFLITAAIFLLLMSTGNRAFTSLILAFSTISTSGILPNNTGKVLEVGFISQFIILLFLFCNLSHTFLTSTNTSIIKRLKGERELRVAVILISVVFLFLFLTEIIDLFFSRDTHIAITNPSRVWAIIFTLFSFVTTTGFLLETSTNQILGVPFSILAALTLVGGGVATTAGGIKLIRVYVLFKHSSNEVRRLTHPRSITGFTYVGRDIKNNGAFSAWIFFMLFAVIGAVMVLLLSFFSINLEDSIILTISAISTNGNLAFLAIENFSYKELDGIVKGCLLLGMLAGRFEMLAILAILLPSRW
jgi:trk system potassium uptake protein TrkH